MWLVTSLAGDLKAAENLDKELWCQEILRHQRFVSGLLPFYPQLLKASFN